MNYEVSSGTFSRKWPLHVSERAVRWRRRRSICLQLKGLAPKLRRSGSGLGLWRASLPNWASCSGPHPLAALRDSAPFGRLAQSKIDLFLVQYLFWRFRDSFLHPAKPKNILKRSGEELESRAAAADAVVPFLLLFSVNRNS